MHGRGILVPPVSDRPAGARLEAAGRAGIHDPEHRAGGDAHLVVPPEGLAVGLHRRRARPSARPASPWRRRPPRAGPRQRQVAPPRRAEQEPAQLVRSGARERHPGQPARRRPPRARGPGAGGPGTCRASRRRRGRPRPRRRSSPSTSTVSRARAPATARPRRPPRGRSRPGAAGAWCAGGPRSTRPWRRRCRRRVDGEDPRAPVDLEQAEGRVAHRPGRQRRRAARGSPAPGAFGHPTARAKTLALPPGSGASATAPPARTPATSATVPSPPRVTTTRAPSATARAARRPASPGASVTSDHSSPCGARALASPPRAACCEAFVATGLMTSATGPAHAVREVSSSRARYAATSPVDGDGRVGHGQVARAGRRPPSSPAAARARAPRRARAA